MPTGSPSKQTIATERYRKKNGIITENFKLKKELVEAYAEACRTAGVSQTGQIAKLMQGFIDDVNAKSGQD